MRANLIQIEASALMEERHLNIGAHVPFSLTVWILHPPAFFEVFEQANKASASYSKQFFGNKAAADSNKKSKPEDPEVSVEKEEAQKELDRDSSKKETDQKTPRKAKAQEEGEKEESSGSSSLSDSESDNVPQKKRKKMDK